MATPTVDGTPVGQDSALEQAMVVINVIGLTKMFNLSCTVLYIYDMITTYDREVSYMWTSGTSVGKLLYFAIRYCTLFVMLAIHIVIFLPQASSKLCTSWIRFHFHMGIVICVLIQFALLLRVYAMYNKNRILFAFLSTSLLCVFTTGTVISVFATKGADIEFVNFGSGSNMHSCAVISSSSWFKAYWAPKTFNEVILFALALGKGIQSYRTRRPGSHLRLIDLLVRDSIMYFFVVFIFYIAAWTVWVAKGISYLEVPAGFAMAMEAIMSQKLLVNLVEEYSERERAGRWAEQSSTPTIGSRPQHMKVEERVPEWQQDIELRESSKFRRPSYAD